MKKLRVKERGRALLYDPLLNKGTAFSLKERRAFQLLGLIPEVISSMEDQLQRRYANFITKPSDYEKYDFLMNLYNRNETLFYRLVLDHIEEMLPYIYTPTVGEISIDFSLQYQQTRGLFISYERQDEIEVILKNFGRNPIDVIVVTDGGRVLGLGDQGAGGMVISIGKLMLYTLFGGIPPERTLPILLDVGTDNSHLLEDPLYIGRREKRVSEKDYDLFMEKFVRAVKKVYPNALVQWEDFSPAHASKLLYRYQKQIVSFNDDIQGTAAVAVAGLLSAVRKKGTELKDEKIAIFGGGGAGIGIATLIRDFLVHEGIPNERALENLYIFDRDGLLHDELLTVREEQKPFVKPFAFFKKFEKRGKISLEDIILPEKITALIGVSAVHKAFHRGIIKRMMKNTEMPIIFPLSNPTNKSEAHPKDLLKWSKGRAIIATGSPFPSIKYRGQKYSIAQCNNVYIFPAVGLAVSAVKLKYIPQEFFLVAAKALSECSKNNLFPSFPDLREVTKFIAAQIIKEAINRNLSNEHVDEKTMDKRIEEYVYFPYYPEYEPDPSNTFVI